MDRDQIKEYIDGLTDDEILKWIDEARTDLVKASNEQPESEWHEACFAALMVYVLEANKRGLHKSLLH